MSTDGDVRTVLDTTMSLVKVSSKVSIANSDMS